MKKPNVLLAITVITVAACSGSPNSSAASPGGAPALVAAAVAATPVSPTPPSKAEAAVKSDESKLEKISPLPAAGQLPTGKWVAGVNYRPLVPAQPTDAAPGKVEVVEMFWYGCAHCYALDPYLESWRKTKPSYIEFRRVPITWQAVHQSHAKLFYTLQALNKEEAVHSDVFAEMNDRKNYMYLQGNDAESLSAQVAFAKARGISEADYTNAYNSFTVQTELSKADDLVHRYKVEGVPLLVINGKYVTDVAMAGSQANVISIINDLASSEKSH